MVKNPKDYYYWRAKKEGYRSRAAYKLQQLNERYDIIKRADTVVDLGASPGGWLQVAAKLSGSVVVGVDLVDIQPIPGVVSFRGDIRQQRTIEKIKLLTKDGVDVILCDASPNLSGNWNYDHGRSIDLCDSALKCAKQTLKPGGNFVVKAFQGDMFLRFLNKVKRTFGTVKAYSPQASRKESAEVYIVGKNIIQKSNLPP